MDKDLAMELVRAVRGETDGRSQAAFERAFELTRAYAASSNAQAVAIPPLMEKLFELFVRGKTT